MNKSGVIILIVIVVIIGLILVLSYSNSQPTLETPNVPVAVQTPVTEIPAATNAPVVTPQNTATMVSFGNKGFSPATVTIKLGESVTWTNNSTGRMWVASDPHPTHTNLPGFDEKSFADAGGFWTYTFNVKGTHTYHNHANPSLKGTVIVK